MSQIIIEFRLTQSVKRPVLYQIILGLQFLTKVLFGSTRALDSVNIWLSIAILSTYPCLLISCEHRKKKFCGWKPGFMKTSNKSITWTNADLGTTFSENWIGVLTFSFQEIHLMEMSSAKWRPFCGSCGSPVWILILHGRDKWKTGAC